jgi:hypothetical protein
LRRTLAEFLDTADGRGWELLDPPDSDPPSQMITTAVVARGGTGGWTPGSGPDPDIDEAGFRDDRLGRWLAGRDPGQTVLVRLTDAEVRVPRRTPADLLEISLELLALDRDSFFVATEDAATGALAERIERHTGVGYLLETW